MALFAQRVGLLDTENAFKIGPYIRQIEEQGKRVIKCNLGEPDFPVPQPIKDEVKRQIDRDNTHYCDPQGILPLRQAVAANGLAPLVPPFGPEIYPFLLHLDKGESGQLLQGLFTDGERQRLDVYEPLPLFLDGTPHCLQDLFSLVRQFH